MTSILNKTLTIKAEEAAAQKAAVSAEEIKWRTQAAVPVRDFVGAICVKYAQDLLAVTTEVKKVSPSRGLVRADFRPVATAAAYRNAGAACLSVLTDEPYSQGSPEHLKQIKAVVGLPVSCKDFITDGYQVYWTRAWGADTTLLIAVALDAERLEHFKQAAYNLNMTVLLKLHERGELEKCRSLTTPLWGVNNRNLCTFEVSLQQALDLLPSLVDKIVITESGTRSKGDVGHMRARDVYTSLIGETFMHTDDTETEARKLF